MNRKTLIAIIAAAIVAVGGGVSYALVQKHSDDVAEQKAMQQEKMQKEQKANEDTMMKEGDPSAMEQ